MFIPFYIIAFDSNKILFINPLNRSADPSVMLPPIVLDLRLSWAVSEHLDSLHWGALLWLGFLRAGRTELALKEWVWGWKVLSECCIIWWHFKYIKHKSPTFADIFSGIRHCVRYENQKKKKKRWEPQKWITQTHPSTFPKFSFMLYHMNYLRYTFVIINLSAKVNSYKHPLINFSLLLKYLKYGVPP